MDTNMFEEQEYTKKIDFSLWKKLLNYAKPHRKQLTVLIVTMVLMATTDALLPLMTRYAVDSFIVEKTTGGLVLFAAVYVGIGLVQATYTWFFVKSACDVETLICTDIRQSAFKRLQELSLSFYDKTPVGWLMARLTSDVQRIGSMIAWGLVNVVWSGAS